MLINKTIKVDGDDWNRFGEICKGNGSTRSPLIRIWVKRYLDKHK